MRCGINWVHVTKLPVLMNLICRVIICFAIIYLSACRNADNLMVVKYKNIGNLAKGARVTLDGIPVGEVVDFNVVHDTVFTSLAIQKNVKLPVRSRFTIHQTLLGPASLVIEPSTQTKFLVASDTVFGESYKEPVLDSAKQKKVQAAFEKMGEGFAELVRALEKDSTGVNK